VNSVTNSHRQWSLDCAIRIQNIFQSFRYRCCTSFWNTRNKQIKTRETE